jgi:hypothetical protein
MLIVLHLLSPAALYGPEPGILAEPGVGLIFWRLPVPETAELPPRGDHVVRLVVDLKFKALALAVFDSRANRGKRILGEVIVVCVKDFVHLVLLLQ